METALAELVSVNSFTETSTAETRSERCSKSCFALDGLEPSRVKSTSGKFADHLVLPLAVGRRERLADSRSSGTSTRCFRREPSRVFAVMASWRAGPASST